ncbi:MAG: potassium channel family protein [Bradymonadia bacterium]
MKITTGTDEISTLKTPPSAVRRRLVVAGLSVVGVIVMGIAGYYALGQGRWSVLQCAYMVLITITTVGYGETLPVSESPIAQIFTIVLLISGMGVSFYFLSALTAFIIEGDLREALWRRRMLRKLRDLEGHYIVCGAGETGRHVSEEIVRAGSQLVVIEHDQDRLDRLSALLGDDFIALKGDATADEVLLEARVEHAAGLVSSLQTDRDNLFVSLTARALNPGLRIVSRGIEEQATAKLHRAGADSVISPNAIGGRRMAHELMTPDLVGFLDLIARDAGEDLEIRQVTLPPRSPVVGRTLADSGIRAASNALVLATIDEGGQDYTYNPSPSVELKAGMRLLVMGMHGSLEDLAQYIAES